MKIVLAGSPSISVAAFEEVIKNFNVVAIVTQPDKPKGRGLHLQPTPVALLGQKYNIKVFKPNRISEIRDDLEALNYDLFLTFAFGQYIPTYILAQGKYKPLNIHGSLLPKYRGAAPIHAAVLNGDSKIGITLMEMVKQMDAGAMYAKAFKEIDKFTTTGDGFKIIEELAKHNIVNWLRQYEADELIPEQQGNDFSEFGKIEKAYAELKNSLTIHEAERKIRGLNPFPGAFLYINNKRLKIFDVSIEEKDGSILLNFSDGILYAIDYQWEGKRRHTL